jgi:hypothetical protein
MFKKAKLYGLVQHTPFFYQIYPVFQSTFVKKKVKIRPFTPVWATSAQK